MLRAHSITAYGLCVCAQPAGRPPEPWPPEVQRPEIRPPDNAAGPGGIRDAEA